jgi:hypothetical protein
MKKWIKERMLIWKWINGLNRWLLDNTAAVENDSLSETENPLHSDKLSDTDHQPQNHGSTNLMMRASNDTAAVENGLTNLMRGGTKSSAAASMMEAWNDTAAVENGWISETENPSQNKTTDKSQNFGSTNLKRGGSNNTAAVRKILCPVIDMTQYSFEDQLDGKQRKIKYMGIRYNCTGPGKEKGKNKNPNEIIKYHSCGMIQERHNGPWRPDQQKRGTGTEKTEKKEEVKQKKGRGGGKWRRKRM